MLDHAASSFRAAVRFAGCSMPFYDRAALGAADMARLVVRDWARRGRDAPPGLRPPSDPVRRPRLAGDLLHARDGAFTDERDAHRMGAHAVARDAAGGVAASRSARQRSHRVLAARSFRVMSVCPPQGYLRAAAAPVQVCSPRRRRRRLAAILLVRAALDDADAPGRMPRPPQSQNKRPQQRSAPATARR